MKVSRNRIYPYPIYSSLTEDYCENDFDIDADIEYDSENAIVKITSSLKDVVMRDYIENKLVGIFCHIECSSTKYREMFELQLNESGEYNIVIPLYKLNDSIEIMCALVAREKIIDFVDDNLSELYLGERISFPQYGTIGYTNTVELTIVKRIDVNGDVPSIFTVCADESSTKINIEYSGDQIVIYLPKEQYDIYENYKGIGVRVKQMMLNIPTLVEIFDLMKEDKSDFEDRPWYTVLEEALVKKGYNGFEDEAFKSKESIILAQELLGEIAKDAFDEFDCMNRDE